MQKRYGVVPRPPGVVYFIARDTTVDGALQDWVSVWTQRPVRVACGGGHYWRSATGEGLDGYVEPLWLVEAWQRFGIVPDTDLELVRVERATELPKVDREKR